MVFILFFLMSLFAVPLQGMETKTPYAHSIVLSPAMKKFAGLKNKKKIMRALMCMNEQTRAEAFRCFPGLEYSFPKKGLYTKPVAEPKAPKNKNKNKKKKKKKKIASDQNGSGVAQKSDEKHATKKIFLYFNDFLEFLYCFFTDPTKYPSDKFKAIELLLNDAILKNKEVQRITERFVRETGISVSCVRKCIEMQSDYFTELAQIETSKRKFVSIHLVDTYFGHYNKGVTELTEKSKKKNRDKLTLASQNGTLTPQLQQSIEADDKKLDTLLQKILDDNKSLSNTMRRKCESKGPSDILVTLQHMAEYTLMEYRKQGTQGVDCSALIRIFEDIISKLKFAPDKRFVDQELAIARQFAKDADQFLKESFDKIKIGIIKEIYQKSLTERQFFKQFALELAQRKAVVSHKRESPILFVSEEEYQEEDEKAEDQVPEAKAASPQVANGNATGLTPNTTVTGFIPVTSKSLVRKKLAKLRKAPHYAYMTSCLQPQADTYVITEDAKMLEVKIPGKNIKLIIAKAGDEQQKPWFTYYNRNIGKAGKQDDQHMLFPPLIVDDMLQNFSCCENNYISSVFHRPIVVKNFPVQVKSIDEKVPARLGCLQISIDNGVCYHRMFQERDFLDYGLQCIVDAAFGQQ